MLYFTPWGVTETPIELSVTRYQGELEGYIPGVESVAIDFESNKPSTLRMRCRYGRTVSKLLDCSGSYLLTAKIGETTRVFCPRETKIIGDSHSTQVELTCADELGSIWSLMGGWTFFIWRGSKALDQVYSRMMKQSLGISQIRRDHINVVTSSNPTPPEIDINDASSATHVCPLIAQKAAEKGWALWAKAAVRNNFVYIDTGVENLSFRPVRQWRLDSNHISRYEVSHYGPEYTAALVTADGTGSKHVGRWEIRSTLGSSGWQIREGGINAGVRQFTSEDNVIHNPAVDNLGPYQAKTEMSIELNPNFGFYYGDTGAQAFREGDAAHVILGDGLEYNLRISRVEVRQSEKGFTMNPILEPIELNRRGIFDGIAGLHTRLERLEIGMRY